MSKQTRKQRREEEARIIAEMDEALAAQGLPKLSEPKEKEEKLHEKYYFYYWNEAIGEMRLVTSWDTTEEDVDGLIAYLKTL